MTNTLLGNVGTIARFKPVHNGHAAMLDALCANADHVTIGIGSSNKYNYDNPFTLLETRAMIDFVLRPKHSNYSCIEVPDLGNGPRWREQALRLFGPLDHFVTANPYVAALLGNDYRIVHPCIAIGRDEKYAVSGSEVRLAMAQGNPWRHMVPSSIGIYLAQNGLIDRFVREFGLATLTASVFLPTHDELEAVAAARVSEMLAAAGAMP